MKTGDGPAVVWAQLAEVKLGAPGLMSAPPGGPLGGGEVLELKLFEDATYRAVVDELAVQPPDRVTWIGHVKGVAGSRVTLIIEDGIVNS